jgi:Flp pilus assembly CpaE family ATPase
VQVERRQGQVIAVHSAKGGLGTTSIAVNLAAALAANRRDARVALADLVVTGGDVRVFLNLSNAYHMGDLASKIDRVDAELLNSILTPTPSGVSRGPTARRPTRRSTRRWSRRSSPRCAPTSPSRCSTASTT